MTVPPEKMRTPRLLPAIVAVVALVTRPEARPGPVTAMLPVRSAPPRLMKPPAPESATFPCSTPELVTRPPTVR
jgi:hypothetical protein